MNANASMLLIGMPLALSPLVYLAGRIGIRLGRPATGARWLALAVFAAMWAIFLTLIGDTSAERNLLLGTIGFHVDAISLLVTVAVLTLGSAAAIVSTAYIRDAQGEEKYYAALIAMTGAMIGLACTRDLFNLWVWFEVMTVASYFLVMFHRDGALEAGVKYLIQSAAGSALILVGIALVLAQTGTLDLGEIAAAATPTFILLGAGGLMLVGFGVKIALVPMHTWLPDAHAQAPSTISALLSGVVIEVALIALLRVLVALAGVTSTWGTLLLAFGALNMLAGNLLALRQDQIKRMLAFSSLAHVGYMLLGLGIALSTGDPAGAQGGFFHLLTHALMKGLAFLAVGALMTGMGVHVLTRTDLNGAARRFPLTALLFTVALISLGGLPPLAGFMSKWQIFVAGFASGEPVLAILVIFGAVMSLLSLGYYIPLINALYREHESDAAKQAQTLPLALTLPLVLLALAVIVLGVFPDLVNSLTAPAADALMTGFVR
jgi:proton-translocating NADH-quinone oxidoreductase chain N